MDYELLVGEFNDQYDMISGNNVYPASIAEFIKQVNQDAAYQPLKQLYEQVEQYMVPVADAQMTAVDPEMEIAGKDEKMAENIRKSEALVPKLQEYKLLADSIYYICNFRGSISPEAEAYWNKFMEEHAIADPKTGEKSYPFGLKTNDIRKVRDSIQAPIREQSKRKEKEWQEEQEKKELDAWEENERRRNEESWNEIERMPGDMRLALLYPGVDPLALGAGKKQKQYQAHLNMINRSVERQLYGSEKRPERIDIMFENLDHIMKNMKVAALKREDSIIDRNSKLYQKINSVVSMEASEKILEKYFPATLEPFMEAAYGEFEKTHKYNAVKREKLLLVNGMSVEEHLKHLEQVPKDRRAYNRLVSNFVGIALQNGYKVEAYVPDKDGKVPAQRIELHAAGSKISEMKMLPERGWEKFCNFFGVETDRQKYNKQVQEYYGNLERSKRDLKQFLGERFTGYEEAYEKDLETLGAEYKFNKRRDEIVDQIIEIAETRSNTPFFADRRAEYVKLTTSILHKKDEFGEDYWEQLTPEEADFDDHLSTFLAATEMEEDQKEREILYDKEKPGEATVSKETEDRLTELYGSTKKIEEIIFEDDEDEMEMNP